MPVKKPVWWSLGMFFIGVLLSPVFVVLAVVCSILWAVMVIWGLMADG
jgi:hypothetical protein